MKRRGRPQGNTQTVIGLKRSAPKKESVKSTKYKKGN